MGNRCKLGSSSGGDGGGSGDVKVEMKEEDEREKGRERERGTHTKGEKRDTRQRDRAASERERCARPDKEKRCKQRGRRTRGAPIVEKRGREGKRARANVLLIPRIIRGFASSILPCPSSPLLST